MVGAPHPESVIRTDQGRLVELKVHKCVWSGEHPGNSLDAIRECYRVRAARAEIDLAILRDQDFLVVHDLDLAHTTDGSGRVDATSAAAVTRLRLRQGERVTDVRPALLSEVVAAIAAEPYPTLLELDLKDSEPWPWPRVAELARLLEPVADRVTFGGGAHWNLRRLWRLAPGLRMGYTLPDDLPRTPLAALRESLQDQLALVPGARDIHVRLDTALAWQRDGIADLADVLHARGMLLDVWTLNAGQAGWRDRLAVALALGADAITTETPKALARAALGTMGRPASPVEAFSHTGEYHGC